MNQFDYLRPSSLDEAVATLSRGTDANAVRPLAGGTDLLTLIKGEIVSPELLIDLKRLPELHDSIEASESGMTLGALTKLSRIENDPTLLRDFTALAESAAIAATPQLRNMATIAGNLLQRPRCWYFRNEHIDCWLKGGESCPARDGENSHHAILATDESPCVAVHPSDPASALLAFDAELRIQGQGGERTVPLRDFFALPTEERRTETTLRANEVIRSISISRPKAGTRSTYLKAMDRKVWAFAVVGVAARARVVDGVIADDVAIVLSGVAPIPWIVDVRSLDLIGQEPSRERFERAAELALSTAMPLAQNGYKRVIAKALIRQALANVTGLPQAE